jgi:hypothetical protein
VTGFPRYEVLQCVAAKRQSSRDRGTLETYLRFVKVLRWSYVRADAEGWRDALREREDGYVYVLARDGVPITDKSSPMMDDDGTLKHTANIK